MTEQAPIVRPPWLSQVQAEAEALASRLMADFGIALQSSLRHLPEPDNKEMRSRQINEFFNVLPSVAARIVCMYGGNALPVEHIFQEIAHKEFAESRGAAVRAAHAKPQVVPPPG